MKKTTKWEVIEDKPIKAKNALISPTHSHNPRAKATQLKMKIGGGIGSGPAPLWNNVHTLPQPNGGFVDNSTGYYQHGGGVGWAILPATQSGHIVDPMGQWAHPGEITTIPDNNITMQGVPYPVLGISDIGHSQIMKPGKEYKFEGNSVTEYPMISRLKKSKGGKVTFTKYPLNKFPLEQKAKGGRVNFNIHNGNSEWRIIE